MFQTILLFYLFDFFKVQVYQTELVWNEYRDYRKKNTQVIARLECELST